MVGGGGAAAQLTGTEYGPQVLLPQAFLNEPLLTVPALLPEGTTPRLL